MNRLLIVVIALALGAVPAAAQPAGSGAPVAGSATPPAAGSAAPAAGSAAKGPGAAGGASTAAPADSSATTLPGTDMPAVDQPIVPTVPGAGQPAAAGQPPGPPPEYPLEPGAVQAATGPCADLKHKPWYEQLPCKPHHTGGTFWLPTGANKAGKGVDSMFIAVTALSLFFFLAITVAVVIFVVKYRGRPGHRAEPSASHNDALEITWTVIPTIIVVFLFYYGWRGYIDMATPPVKAVEIQVVAQKWSWTFVHPNGVSDSNLHVPSDQPVRLVMTSKDVLHSFFAPSLRTKMDVLPRRYTYVWFEAEQTRAGVYRLYCTEFCGRDHSQMKVKLVIHKPGMYERYLAEKAESDVSRPLDQIGAELYEKKNCVGCHTLDGSIRVGPSFKGSFGTEITLSNGAKQQFDENYIRESLTSPLAKARPGFPPSMPSFADQLKERQILGLIEFIKAQNPAYKPEPAPQKSPEAPGQ